MVYRRTLLFLAPLLVSTAALAIGMPNPDYELGVALDRSVPYIGAGDSHHTGYTGEGILIGIIDTGVDGAHPDLQARAGALVDSHDLFGGSGPPDASGHGTSVAGVIAAHGDLQGVAPGAKLISYRVSDDGESVSSDLIIAAIDLAIADGVDIINISLGVNRTNARIDEAVNGAVERGITVVAAAGNDGPDPGTIGSPGLNSRAITVGATYNNLTSSLTATLEAGGRQFHALPMVGAPPTAETIMGELVYGGYARERDLQGDLTGRIVLAERGSDVEGEVVYFSDKEYNAAAAAAAALIVYNNEPGAYLGELLHEYTTPDYTPQIPVVSISRQEGLELRELLQDGTSVALRVFHDPDFVAHFSSRGPVSPFYVKPDLVAPGVFVNTTTSGGAYNLTSGTSFAAPHVSGVAALLLEKNPGLGPYDIRSILVTTADSISDEYGDPLGPDLVGSGRLNATKALEANLIITPPFLMLALSPQIVSDEAGLTLERIGGGTCECTVHIDSPNGVDMDYSYENNMLTIRATLDGATAGQLYGRITITDGDDVYGVPVVIHSTPGSILAREDGGAITVDVLHPEEWTYARIIATDSATGKTYVESAHPGGGRIEVFGNGTYWIEARIDSDGETLQALGVVDVGFAPAGSILPDLGIPYRQASVIAVVLASIAAVGFVLRRG